MKAEHRHELKTNELAQWLSSLPAWAQQNLRTIIYVTVVVVIVVAYTIWYRYQKTVVVDREQANMTGLLTQLPQLKAYIAQTQMEGKDNSYMLMQPANALESIAGSTKNESVAALALIKQADILRTELLFRLGPVSRQDLENQIGRAKQYYTKALVEHLERSPNRSLEAMAKLGLGLCEEELGNLDQARKIYDELATGTTFEGTTSSAAAKQRLILMDSFNQKIVLMPSPRPVTPAPTEPPAILPAPESQVQIAPETNAQFLK
jgi:trehalose/maltose hydrolase-like predicted phosphorylase